MTYRKVDNKIFCFLYFVEKSQLRRSSHNVICYHPLDHDGFNGENSSQVHCNVSEGLRLTTPTGRTVQPHILETLKHMITVKINNNFTYS